jgi:radical SAM protein with 4Fe4S-binding SPASM domain
MASLLRDATFSKFRKTANGKKVVLFGAGVHAEKCVGLLKGYGIEPHCIVDNDIWKWNREQSCLKCCPPGVLRNPEGIVVLIASTSVFEIEKQLQWYGVQDYFAYLLFFEEIHAEYGCQWYGIPLNGRPLHFSTNKYINIQIADVCNLRCPMCRFIKNSTGEMMTVGRFSDILRQVKQAETAVGGAIGRIRLDGNREALTHPDFSKFVILAKSYGFHVDITTNGVLLNRETIQTVMACDFLNISCTGISKDIYKSFQGSGKDNCNLQLEKVKNNVSALIASRKATETDLYIQVSYIVNEVSVAEAREALFFWQSLGVDKVWFTGEGRENENLLRQNEVLYRPGNECGNSITVSSSGEVFPCCIESGESMSLGNCFEMPLSEIFASDRWIRFFSNLSALNSDTLPQGCKGCGVITRLK